MRTEEPFFQFPLCVLALPDMIDHVIAYGFIEAGRLAMSRIGVDDRKDCCKRFGLRMTQANSWELAAHLGAETCGIRIGNLQQAIDRYHKVVAHRDAWTQRHGAEPLVRIRTDLCFRARDGQGLSIREFRVLAAIYSSIGANPYRGVTESIIRVRAIGCKSSAVMNAEKASLPPLLSEKAARGTVTRLHQTGFFARVTPNRHGRRTFYSHRLTDSDLRDRLLASLTYSKKFADERRKKEHDLADQIRAKKGDYNSAQKGDYNSEAPEEHQSSATEGRREGDAGATEGRREGDYDRKTLNRKTLNRKTPDISTPTPSKGMPQPQAAEADTLSQSVRVLEMVRELTEPEDQGIRGYVLDGKFMSTEEANQFFVDNPDLPTELLKKFKPAIKRGDVVELTQQ